jgi:phosphotransferase system HPr-like phosphotransfer protein
MYADVQLQLAELEVEAGDTVHIIIAGKDDNDRWQAEVSKL